ncbi:muramoyltetrapeptide carboxypeptidase [Filimonas lacunae]|uniref:Muramoyltetrapeptide carboxypeptidase n=1 Tax=Filimonas lacunae TaxID=477680 RepID=A0A173MMY5_9BACT|nr:LD-carboxypeptidase [Filimonas lacunae]BAV08829.1 muramoyltetrapeptide carboxypeptidase [Filimonas lacunae]SIS62423.1 muramoyltetrapeptide carboxypeptidase [Filimonas lacunae]
MNRKSFIQQAGLLLAASSLPTSFLWPQKKQATGWIIPSYLKKGDVVGITSPAGFIAEKDILSAVQQLTSWGFAVEVGKTIGTREGSLGGTDEARLADFQYMLNNRRIKAILCARGGYGIIRILDKIDFSSLRSHPKWIIGFSDITVLHWHIHQNYHVATLHSKMCNSFPDDWSKADAVQMATIQSIQQALTGEKMTYSAIPNLHNRLGKATGQLIGGNLRTIENLAGTRSDIEVAGKILFVEDVHEKLYNIDRMFWSLKRTGKLKQLKGLLIGGFSVDADLVPEEEFPKDIYAIVQEKVKPYTYPVCFDFPVGHQRNNFALKCGMQHRLTVTATAAELETLR